MGYVLFESCKVISGHRRSMILDIQRKAYYFIPAEYSQLIGADGALKYSNKVGKEEYEEFINFLLSEELVFDCPPALLKNFRTKYITEWAYPAPISNAILEFAALDEETLNNSLQQIEALNCRYVELRFTESLDFNSLKSITDILNEYAITAYILSISISKDESEATLLLLQSTFRLYRTNVFNWHEDTVLVNNDNNYGNIFFTQNTCSKHLCGITSPDYFTINIDFFKESQNHNTCLNRKVAIDAEGNIKNCLSMQKSFGKIKDTNLTDVVNSAEFQKLWRLSKDLISVCKDCEFRHVCTDCRAYLEDPGDINSKPLKCGYSPYTCTWEEWSTNPLKQDAINYYEMSPILSS